MAVQDGLKNRGYERKDVNERFKAVEELTGERLTELTDYTFDPSIASKNIENMIGVTQIPLGFAGPVQINGDLAQGSFIIPLATTEGALVASVSRGMSVITASGGSRVRVFEDAMTRAPILRVDGIDHSVKVIEWISGLDYWIFMEGFTAENASKYILMENGSLLE